MSYLIDQIDNQIDDPDYRANRARLRIAKHLLEQGEELIDPSQMTDGVVVPVSPLQGLDKIGKALAGAYIYKHAKQRQAGEVNEDALQSSLENAGGTLTPSSISTPTPTPAQNDAWQAALTPSYQAITPGLAKTNPYANALSPVGAALMAQRRM